MAVRIGIIGAGGIASYHARHYLATPQAQVIAITDVAPERAVDVAAAFQIPNVEPTVERLLARPDIDAVTICTPNDSHAPLAIAAAKAGKHVLCEKPLALDVAEATRMVDAVEAAGVQHMVNFSKRPFPAIIQLSAMIAAGELGEVLQVESTYLQSWLLAPSLGADAARHVWRLDRRVAGSGVLGDLSSHIIDLVQHLVGPIERVCGLLETKAQRSPAPSAPDLAHVAIDDHATLMARFTGGASGVLISSRVAAGTRDELQLRLYGSKGAARFDNAHPDRLQVCLGEANRKYFLWSEMACPLPPGVPASLDAAFVRGIVSGTPASPTFHDGLRVQQVMAAAEASAAVGGWVAVG
ncbi:MAG: Gfo/Idh/MocA family oxidoreductase [Chloroflexi bacterium]|nr:Gfo/Idh/MocA family oxidoreductase [Chloroflexota bacterium]